MNLTEHQYHLNIFELVLFLLTADAFVVVLKQLIIISLLIQNGYVLEGGEHLVIIGTDHLS